MTDNTDPIRERVENGEIITHFDPSGDVTADFVRAWSERADEEDLIYIDPDEIRDELKEIDAELGSDEWDDRVEAIAEKIADRDADTSERNAIIKMGVIQMALDNAGEGDYPPR